MAYKIVNMWTPESLYKYKCPYAMQATEICIHNTANTAPARNEVAYMNSNTNYVSFHVAIDDKEVVQAIPFNRNAFHTGDGVGINSGNRKAIGIEICYSMDNGYAGAKSQRYIEAENNTIEYVAYILLERGWDVSRVKQHWNYSGKDCPHKIRAHKDWNNFVNKIAKKLQELKNANKPKAKAPVKTVAKKVSTPVKRKKAVSKVKPVLTGKTHIVKSGDTLWALSNNYNVSIEDIKEWNKLKSDRIFEDMKLFMSEPVKKTVVAKKKAPVKTNKVVAKANKQNISNSKNNLTEQQAISLINSFAGNIYDTDRSFGAQCFDLANVYWLAMYGHSLKGVGAKDIPTWNDFTNEAKVYNNTPEFLAKAGDLVVWMPKGGSGYGHVAIVLAANLNSITVVEQNWLGGGRTMSEKATVRKHSYDFPMWFIRPHFR